jgi:hypothetical protein
LNSAAQFSAFRAGAGFLKMRTDYHTSGGLQISNILNTGTQGEENYKDYSSDSLTLQMVTAFDNNLNTTKVPFLYLGARPEFNFAKEKATVTFTSFASNSDFKLSEGVSVPTEGMALPILAVRDYTLTLSGAKTNIPPSFSFRLHDKEIGTDAGTYKALSESCYFDWSASATGAEVYAILQYNAPLTAADLRQNHLAGLAKFFRLDISAYLDMSDAQRAAVHTAMADRALSDDRATVVAAYVAATTDYYEGLGLSKDETLNAAFAALAAAAHLDVHRLTILDKPDAFMQALVDEFDPAYAVSKTVIGSILDKDTEFIYLNFFAETRVRTENGANVLPGVRATFEIDEEMYAELIKTYGEGAVEFGTHIVVDGEVRATLAFTPKANAEGGYDYVGTNTVAGKAPVAAMTKVVTDKNGEEHLTYTYAVTYDTLSKEMLEREFSFRRFIKLGNETYEITVDCSVFDTVFSGAEVYGYFAENGYADDDVVKSVMGVLNAQ